MGFGKRTVLPGWKAMLTPAGQVSRPAVKSRVNSALGVAAGCVAHPPRLAEDRQVRAAVADEGGGQVGPVDVQLGQRQPSGVQVGGDAAGDARLRLVGGGDARRDDQAGVQVAQHVPLVAVEAHRAGLTAVAHVAVFDADPPVAGHAAAQRRRRAGGIHVLVPDLAGHLQQAWRGVAARRGGDEPFHPLQQAQHLDQRLIPRRRDRPSPCPARPSGSRRPAAALLPVRPVRRFQRPAPTPARPRSHPGPCAGRVPSS